MHFKILECPEYSAIQQGLLDYIQKYTSLLVNNPRDSSYNGTPLKYANFVDIKHFINHNPIMLDWCKSLGMIPRDVYFTLCWDRTCSTSQVSSCPIHLDKPPVHWKLNFPILNMETTSVRFFEPKDPTVDIQSLVTRMGDADSKDQDVWLLQYEDFVEVAHHSFEKFEPIIMDGLLPHDVGFYGAQQFPRIGTQIMFLKEPTHLL
jgi:hypothetical protein